MKVRKAIIPAGGLGTRFLPATKAQPKEMLPIVDKPTIQYIVEEAVESGIEDIIIVSGRGKRSIEDHFDKSYELENTLATKEKWAQLEEVQSITKLANIHYIRQKEPLGLGHAIASCQAFVGSEPFAVLLGDDIVRSTGVPCLKQLIAIHQRYHTSVVGVQTVSDNDVSKYGIVAPKGVENEQGVISLDSLIEKPSISEAPSNYAIMGRYILNPEIFPILKTLKPGTGGEIQLTDAINLLNASQAVLAYQFEGIRYDIGDKVGFIRATIDFALERNDLRQNVRSYMEEVLKRDSSLQSY
ncbi:UTP--glucose-1-phosphate uridylyltransferase GalU [Bacillus luteolus]|uniref:UTP--glucose-1-phosphate uridylyltransferase n=1 Tax=Litchfieldia luteola TaxID=682179 RepID=A0ABR9QJ64_9BACI|nr:UTP--glucose-1-phosphate uridylyltransferase GalU [Cytobacillus luteolus]MBE4908543.1 UTP--glucose-1-phosphate uridylyltransferase GalU [Cytobacillus luteolus]MBP1941396.1 UTP--glucose-1-phosphate uridylyltransferase [Cytobacillus luteolus]